MDFDEADRMTPVIDHRRARYPHCIVWTPIPLITWIFPFIGHMGICLSNGVIRDFSGPYSVSEDSMAFGKPTRYIELNLDKVPGGQRQYDRAVKEASDIYTGRIHNLFCDNCHSHVSLALETMRYNNRDHYNMIQLAFWTFFAAQYVSFTGFLKQWCLYIIVVIVYSIVYLVGLYNNSNN